MLEVAATCYGHARTCRRLRGCLNSCAQGMGPGAFLSQHRRGHAPSDTVWAEPIGHDVPMSSPQRLCVLVDPVEYARKNSAEQRDVRQFLATIPSAFASVTETPVAEITTQFTSDTLMVIFPEHADTPRVESMVQKLTGWLEDFNAAHRSKLRIRLALDIGFIRISDIGHYGSPPITVSRLADSAPVKALNLDVALAVSDSLYQRMLTEAMAEGRALRGFEPVHPVNAPDGWMHTGGAISRPDSGKLFAVFRAQIATAVDEDSMIHRFIARGLVTRDALLDGLPEKDAFVAATHLDEFRRLSLLEARPYERAELGRAVLAALRPRVLLGLMGPVSIFILGALVANGPWKWLLALLVTVALVVAVGTAQSLGRSRRGGVYFFYFGGFVYAVKTLSEPVPARFLPAWIALFSAATLATYFLFPFLDDFAKPCGHYLRSILRTAGRRERRERAAQLTAWLADAHEQVIVPGLIQAINQILGDDIDVLLVEQDSAGLRSLSPDAFVETHSLRRVEAALNRSANSSIAVAGPRGVGKSTMIDRLVQRYDGPDRFALKVSAPAGYVPKEFLVHLFQQLCEQAVPGQRTHPVSRRPHPVVAVARLAALALTALLVWSFATDLQVRKLPGWERDWWEHHRLLTQCVGLAVAATLWRWPRRSRESKLAALARRNLDQLRYETTTTSGGEASVMQAKFTRSWARKNVQWTMPELVDRLNEFLAAITAGGRVVLIGIDEVDRIGDVAQAEQFVSEIKAVFRVPDCLFVVSVAEEVGALFARRAIVGRSMFENAFDEIVIVEPLRLDEAAQLLQLRVPGFTQLFIHLAYALSGGLPRELLRVTRQLIEVNSERRPPPKLPELARLLVREELHEAIDGTRLRLAQLPDETKWGALFSDLTSRLAAFSPQADLARQRVALADLAALTTATPATPAGEALAGLTAFADLGLTVVDTFDQFALQPVPAPATDPAQYVRLAAARRELSLSPTSCRTILTGIRTDFPGG